MPRRRGTKDGQYADGETLKAIALEPARLPRSQGGTAGKSITREAVRLSERNGLKHAREILLSAGLDLDSLIDEGHVSQDVTGTELASAAWSQRADSGAGGSVN